MTSITTETIRPRPSARSLRQPILGFVAGLALATSAAIGVNVVSSDGASSSKVTTSTTSSAVAPSSPDAQCRIHRGPC